ncbi:MAG: hypothetical protein KAI45_03435, partial [Melioribacteraceae bacterium]|nr:hypothetical protein [Melioribacteraceae bacterium]
MKKLYAVHILILLSLIIPTEILFAQEISDSEKERKIVVERMDRMNLLSKTKAVIDKSEKMLEIPESIKHLKGFTVAKTPPTIEFVIVPLENRYLKSVPKGYFQGIWSSWSQGNYYAPTQKYYAAIGNHGFYYPELYLIEYDSQ